MVRCRFPVSWGRSADSIVADNLTTQSSNTVQTRLWWDSELLGTFFVKTNCSRSPNHHYRPHMMSLKLLVSPHAPVIGDKPINLKQTHAAVKMLWAATVSLSLQHNNNFSFCSHACNNWVSVETLEQSYLGGRGLHRESTLTEIHTHPYSRWDIRVALNFLRFVEWRTDDSGYFSATNE